jgi:hypothetical protein
MGIDPLGNFGMLPGEARDPRRVRVRFPITLVQFRPAILETASSESLIETTP